MTNGDGEEPTEIGQKALVGKSVQTRFLKGEEPEYVMNLVRIWGRETDTIPEWGTPPRDAWLRDFWKAPGNDILQGAVSSMQKKMKALPWAITGGKRLVTRYQSLLANAEQGKGWGIFLSKVVEDYLTQDRGAFIEIIHATSNPSSPIVGLAHLDAGRCWPTGMIDKPVIYEDSKNKKHLLKETQVIHFADMPSPEEERHDRGMCAVSRVLKAAMIIRAFAQYKDEKLSSRPLPGFVVASNVTQGQIRTALKSADEEEIRKHGRMMYRNIPIIAALSAEHEISIEMVEFRSVPDGFDGEAEITLFVYMLALSFGVDAREFWPATLTGATKADALIQAQKARGKGPGDIITQMERALNWKVLPANCEFEFDFQDDEEDRLQTEIRNMKIEGIRKMWEPSQITMTGIITDEEARNLLVDQDILPREFRIEDITEEETLGETEKAKELSGEKESWWSRLE